MALLVLDLDRPAVLIERAADVKDMQCARDVEEQRYLREVSPRADPDSGVIYISIHVTATAGEPQTSTRLLPNPKMNALGSRTAGSSLPSRMKRSGRNSSGASYASGSCMMSLFMAMSATGTK